MCNNSLYWYRMFLTSISRFLLCYWQSLTIRKFTWYAYISEEDYFTQLLRARSTRCPQIYPKLWLLGRLRNILQNVHDGKVSPSRLLHLLEPFTLHWRQNTVALIQNAFSVVHICFVYTVRTKFAWPLWDPQMKCWLFSLQQSPDGSVKVLFGMQIFHSLSKNIFCMCMHCRILLLCLGVNNRK